jgi:hypothetical protein
MCGEEDKRAEEDACPDGGSEENNAGLGDHSRAWRKVNRNLESFRKDLTYDEVDIERSSLLLRGIARLSKQRLVFSRPLRINYIWDSCSRSHVDSKLGTGFSGGRSSLLGCLSMLGR